MDLQDHDGGARLHAYVRSHQRGIEGQLAEWVRVPGVLGMPEHTQDLLRSANWLAAAFREAGFPVVEVQPTGESHAVYAEWCAAPGAPTGRLYGRGSSDAKGQVLAHLWGLRAHLHHQATRSLTYDRQNPDALSPLDAESQTLSHPTSPLQERFAEPAPAVNLKFLVEGEEEGGSANLAALLEGQAERFQADVVLFSDTILWRADHPALCMGLRGMLSASLEICGPCRDVHSGAVSGTAPVSLELLLNGAVTLACFWNELARMHQPKDDGDGHLRQ